MLFARMGRGDIDPGGLFAVVEDLKLLYARLNERCCPSRLV